MSSVHVFSADDTSSPDSSSDSLPPDPFPLEVAAALEAYFLVLVSAFVLAAESRAPRLRGLHSFTFQLHVSAFHGMSGARRGCLGVSGGVESVYVVLLCQKRLRLS